MVSEFKSGDSGTRHHRSTRAAIIMRNKGQPFDPSFDPSEAAGLVVMVGRGLRRGTVGQDSDDGIDDDALVVHGGRDRIASRPEPTLRGPRSLAAPTTAHAAPLGPPE